MPLLATSQEWFTQSSLLLKARPTTTRITSRYTILNPSSAKVTKSAAKKEKRRAAKAEQASAPATTTTAASAGPKGTFVLKTFDSESGTCLKYETNKGAEVGRLISTLGRLARHMASLPEIAEDTTMLDAPPAADGTSTPAEPTINTAATAGGSNAPSQAKGGAGASGGGGAGAKKKKKGKK